MKRREFDLIISEFEKIQDSYGIYKLEVKDGKFQLGELVLIKEYNPHKTLENHNITVYTSREIKGRIGDVKFEGSTFYNTDHYILTIFVDE
jgi:hypothetical protein